MKEVINIPSETLEEDLDSQLKSERIFEILTQVLLDICTHIVANVLDEPPKTYAGCMKKLGELQIISPQLAKNGADMIKMRNLVVHQYANINYDLLYEGLIELSRDFPQIQKEILAWAENHHKKEKDI